MKSFGESPLNKSFLFSDIRTVNKKKKNNFTRIYSNIVFIIREQNTEYTEFKNMRTFFFFFLNKIWQFFKENQKKFHK